MNMISTGSFQTETSASNKKSELLKTLTAAWEKKNSNAARAGGVSLMALTLAACGSSEDTTAFSQADVDAAKAEGEAAGAAAEAAAMIDAINEALGTSLTGDEDAAAIIATIAASNDADIAAEATEAAEAAAAIAAEAVAATAAEALAASQAETATAQAAADSAAADLAALQATYDALVAPRSLSFEATTAETLNGGEGNDTFTGAGTFYTNADKIRDTSSTDNDTANITVTGDITPDISGVENVNLTINSTATKTVTASSLVGVNTLTLTRGDVTVGDAVISGNKAHDIDALDAAEVSTVTIAGTATNVALDQATTAGVTLNADVATGSVTVVGAGTINAAGAGTGDTVTVTAMTNAQAGSAAAEAVQNAKAVVVNTGAETVAIASGVGSGVFDGSISVTGATTKNVTIAAASGGATVNVLGETGTVGTDGVVIAGIDASGASVTTSVAGTSTAKGVISVDGSGATDAATVSAAGITTLATAASNQIETLNLSGNGAAVTYEVTGAATTYNITGDQNVTLSGNESSFDGKTVTDTSTGTSTIKITTLDDSDLSLAAVDNILVTSNVASKTLTLASGANVTLGTDITTAFAVAGKAAGATINIATADDTAASGATIDITTGTLTASSNVSTLNIDATVGKLTIGTATTGATTTAINISGTKAVDLGGVTAASVTSTSSATVKVNASSTALTSVTTGSGDDTIIMDEAAAVTVSTGDGVDTITAAAAAESAYSAGGGNDVLNLNNANAVSIDMGAGNDNVKIADDIDSDAIIVGGAGEDTLTFLEDSTGTTASKTNFAFSGFEIIDITTAGSGGNTISAAQFAGNSSFQLIGDSTDDTLIVVNNGSAGANIDASNVTFASTQAATLNLTGAADLQDVITGSAKNDTITGTTGGDTIDGGAGTDTFLAANLKANNIEGGTSDSTGVVINLGSTAVTATSVLSEITSFTADSITSVGGGEIAYVFAASGATNSAVISSITNVENITGTTGADYIVTGSGANTVNGNGGADYIKLDTAGGDTVVISSTATANTTIASFTVGAAGDVIDLSAAASGTGVTAGAIDAAINLNGVGGAAVAVTDGLTTIADQVTGAITAATIHAVVTGGANDLTLANADNVVYLLVDNGTDSALARVNGTAGNVTIEEAEITVVATFDGIADYSTILAANFADFA